LDFVPDAFSGARNFQLTKKEQRCGNPN